MRKLVVTIDEKQAERIATQLRNALDHPNAHGPITLELYEDDNQNR